MSPLSAMGDKETDVIQENIEELETVDVPLTTSTDIEQESPFKEPVATEVPVSDDTVTSPSKPKKLLALQYNYSDSEDDETREDRKSRMVSYN